MIKQFGFSLKFSRHSNHSPGECQEPNTCNQVVFKVINFWQILPPQQLQKKYSLHFSLSNKFSPIISSFKVEKTSGS